MKIKSKILIFIIATLTAGLMLMGCSKSNDPDHYIRVKNEFAETIMNLQVGSANYANVNPGTLTGYIHVYEGVNPISGNTGSGVTLSGSVSVSGKGTHRWTLTILSSGGANIVEDGN